MGLYSSDSPKRRGPPRRTNSSPFLRKPVPIDYSDYDATERQPPRRQLSYSSVQQLVRSGSNSSNNCDNLLDASQRKRRHQSDAGGAGGGGGGGGATGTLERHLDLFDLVLIGVGGTIGSGLFVLAGLVSNEYAGPAASISWCLSGFAACLSGCCYAELSGRIPLAGSAYAYTYVAMGEVFAVVSAACLSLEYICAAAAVARSWGDKTVEWISDIYPGQTFLTVDSAYSPLAFLIAAAIVALLLCGVKESKRVANFFTTLKVALVTFMVVVALWHTHPSNWVPFAPYGVSGVIRGATGTFFGYLGYDQVCCLAAEAKDPKRNLPRAILGVLSGCTVLYVVATLALTGMIPYDQISPVSGFPDGFRMIGAHTAEQITAVGEIVTLPIVVLVTIMAQPRLQYAMAVDGLLPSVFQDLDAQGNLFSGTCIVGGIMTIVAAFVPFEYLNDMISCAVLCALSMTDTSVIMLWHEPVSDPESPLTCHLMMAFHAAALVGSLSLTHLGQTGNPLTALCVLTMMGTCAAVHRYCPRTAVFGGRRKNHYHEHELVREKGYFQTPMVPFLPCLAIAINWYLIAQLALVGVSLLLGFLVLSVFYYFLYARYHSVGNTQGWSDEEEFEMATDSRDVDDKKKSSYLI